MDTIPPQLLIETIYKLGFHKYSRFINLRTQLRTLKALPCLSRDLCGIYHYAVKCLSYDRIDKTFIHKKNQHGKPVQYYLACLAPLTLQPFLFNQVGVIARRKRNKLKNKAILSADYTKGKEIPEEDLYKVGVFFVMFGLNHSRLPKLFDQLETMEWREKYWHCTFSSPLENLIDLALVHKRGLVILKSLITAHQPFTNLWTRIIHHRRYELLRLITEPEYTQLRENIIKYPYDFFQTHKRCCASKFQEITELDYKSLFVRVREN